MASTPTVPILPFLSGKLPKDKYSSAQELVEDLVKILAIDSSFVTSPLINLPDLKGEKGDKGDRGNRGDKGDKGIQGIQGTQGDTFVYNYIIAGWVTGTVYARYDVVPYGGKLYLCTSSHMSGSTTEPGVGVDWATKWQIFLSQLTFQTFQILTYGATTTWAASASVTENHAKVTLTGDTTLAMSGWVAGMSGVLKITQDGTGSRLLTALPSGSKTAGGIPTLSTAATAIDMLKVVYDGTNYLWTAHLNMS